MVWGLGKLPSVLCCPLMLLPFQSRFLGLLRSDMCCHVRVIDVGAARLIMRDDVSVITQPLSRFTPTGVEFEGGRKEDYDAVVFATGFQMASGHYDWLDRELSDMIGRGKTALEAGLQVRPPALTLLDPEPENEPEALPCFSRAQADSAVCVSPTAVRGGGAEHPRALHLLRPAPDAARGRAAHGR